MTKTKDEKEKKMEKSFTHLKAIISPGAEFHFASLIIERKPGDVNLTGGLEDPRWNIETGAIITYHNICGVSAIESFVGTAKQEVNGETRNHYSSTQLLIMVYVFVCVSNLLWIMGSSA